ncbi:MAG: dicarboxylate/amino acid:cation symporter [Gammaproteobacteria bacterium]|nr:dicarboxylate/amino acid:cation symporter [Gammaproteobacteria bacterium]
MSEASETSETSRRPSHWLLYAILAAIVLATLTGGFLPELAAETEILGELFLNALKMIVVPLVMLSIMVGITNLGDIRSLGPIGGRTVLYYMTTTGLAVILGMLLVNVIAPGEGLSEGERHPAMSYRLDGEGLRTVELEGALGKRYDGTYALTLTDQNVTGMISAAEEGRITVTDWRLTTPNADYLTTEAGERLLLIDGARAKLNLNPAGQGIAVDLPMAASVKDKEGRGIGSAIREVFLGNPRTGKEGMIPENVFKAMAETDILPLIFFALLIGAALSVLGERGRPAIAVISALNDAVMQLVNWIMVTAPIGIFGLVAARIGEAGGFSGFLPELMAVSKYFLTVLLGLTLHGVVVLPLLLMLFARRNPVAYAGGMSTALLNAFSTASSSATLPVSMKGTTEGNGVSKRSSSFVLPLGATINMDGTALYEAIAAMFIAQVYAISLGLGDQVVIVLTATLAAIGAAGIPEAGLVTMVIVLNAVGLPIEGISLILAVDWLLDRFRTTVNVWGDSIGAGVIDAYEVRDSGKTAQSG